MEIELFFCLATIFLDSSPRIPLEFIYLLINFFYGTGIPGRLQKKSFYGWGEAYQQNGGGVSSVSFGFLWYEL
jgi:hypothetical protein